LVSLRGCWWPARSAGALQAAGLALLLGGATGNVTDRILHGAVTDFLEVWLRFMPWRIFHPWPAFNVADSAVTIGAVLSCLRYFSAGNTLAHPAKK